MKSSEDDRLPEHEAGKRFSRLVGNLVNTLHEPHVEKGDAPERAPP